jgi:methylenetetrahydrofolate--tRNA-(uracil-5-)-methyltransferase
MSIRENEKKVAVIGAGLAGVECASYLAGKGVKVTLFEGKSKTPNPAQSLPDFAELVCTNSLKSNNPFSAHGLLKWEMRQLGSTILQFADEFSVPAGDALAVDRKKFSAAVTNFIQQQENITVVEKVVAEVEELLSQFAAVVIATGPLTYGGLDSWIRQNISGDDFYFYDAIAPIVDADSLDLSQLYFKDRHCDDAPGDYLNVPLSKQQYYDFIEELRSAKKVPAKDFEQYRFFESCLPIDTMAERGIDTARFSCMKPIGLSQEGFDTYAVVQLRKENLLGDAYNMVGFQTKLTYAEQKRVFRMLPGFTNAEFLHYGSIHRNSFLHAAKLLTPSLNSRKYPTLFFAGQLTGVEGYTESAAMGQYVGREVLRLLEQRPEVHWPVECCFGALINYLMQQSGKPRPSNINFGLLPTVSLTKEQRRDRKRRKRIKKELVAKRGQEVFANFLATHPELL